MLAENIHNSKRKLELQIHNSKYKLELQTQIKITIPIWNRNCGSMLFQFGIVEIEFAGQSNIISIVEITRYFCHFGARRELELYWLK